MENVNESAENQCDTLLLLYHKIIHLYTEDSFSTYYDMKQEGSSTSSSSSNSTSGTA